MQLLVSVSDVSEARAALEGGADIIDAKDPHSGALGPVAPVVLEGIARAVGDQRTITAALGDVDDSGLVGQLASTAARSGARFVKIGVGLVSDPLRASHLVAAASRACANGPEPTRLVAVTYADAPTGVGLDPIALVAIASRAGAHGVLVDTSIKDGPGLSALWTRQQIRSWVAAAHSDGMIAAVAGRLGVKDL